MAFFNVGRFVGVEKDHKLIFGHAAFWENIKHLIEMFCKQRVGDTEKNIAGNTNLGICGGEVLVEVKGIHTISSEEGEEQKAPQRTREIEGETRRINHSLT